MIDYTALSDNELQQIYLSGDDNAGSELAVRYRRTVNICTRPYFLTGGDSEDLIQEGMIGLFKALQDYDIGRDASFSTFAQLCVSRQMFNAVQASQRQKHIPLNSYISLYGNSEEGKDNASIIENVASSKDVNPEDMVIDKENVEAIEKAIGDMLSEKEKQVLDLSMTGMGYVEIAKVLGLDEKSTDNALQRARTKVKKLIF